MTLIDLLKTLDLRQEILIAIPHHKYKDGFLRIFRGEVT